MKGNVIFTNQTNREVSPQLIITTESNIQECYLKNFLDTYSSEKVPNSADKYSETNTQLNILKRENARLKQLGNSEF